MAHACDTLALTLGWGAERYEQGRATRITEGLPDRRYVHRGRGLRVWVELKAPGGKLTRAQHAWLTAEQQAGAHALVVDDVAMWARVMSLLARDAGRGEALRYCMETTALIAQRGYRGERAVQRGNTRRAA